MKTITEIIDSINRDFGHIDDDGNFYMDIPQYRWDELLSAIEYQQIKIRSILIASKRSLSFLRSQGWRGAVVENLRSSIVDLDSK